MVKGLPREVGVGFYLARLLIEAYTILVYSVANYSPL